MATGIIASIGASSTINYTPGNDGKLILSGTGTGQISLQGGAVLVPGTPGASVSAYVAADVPLIITTGASTNCVASINEG